MSFPVEIKLYPGEELRETSDKRQALGTRAVSIDGREFAYALAGEALDVGIPCASAAQPGDLSADTSAKLVTSITTYATTASYLRISTTWGSPGGSTGVTKNMFRDGYVWLWTGTGAGQMLRVKSNTTGSSGTAGQYTDLQFRDDDRLHEAIDTQVTLAVVRNKYDSVIEYDGLSTLTGPIVGVPPRDITSGYYFWLQVKGLCPVLTDGTVVLGNKVYPTTSTGIQAVAPSNTTDVAVLLKSTQRQAIGTVFCVAGDTEYSLVDIDL